MLEIICIIIIVYVATLMAKAVFAGYRHLTTYCLLGAI